MPSTSFLGEIASLLAACCWAIGLTLFRRDVRAIGARQVNLFKGIVGGTLFLLALVVVPTRGVPLEDASFLLLSGVCGLALGDTFLFRALGELGPHRTALLAGVGTMLTVAGGWLFLGESLGPQRLAGVALAAAGVTVVLYFRGPDAPSGAATLRGVAFGALAACGQASGVLLAKHGVRNTDALSATVLRLLAGTAVLALFALLRGGLGGDLRRLTRAPVLARLVPAAFFGTFLGIWLMQTGIAHTESGVANALHSTTPLFTLPIAVFVLRERLSAGAIAGSIVAVAGVVLLVLGA